MPAHEKHAIEIVENQGDPQAQLVNKYVIFRNRFLSAEVGSAVRGTAFIALRAKLLNILPNNEWVRANLPNAMQELKFVIEIGEELKRPEEQLGGLREAYTHLLAYSKQGIWGYIQTNVAAFGKSVSESAAGVLAWVQNWWRGEVAPAPKMS